MANLRDRSVQELGCRSCRDQDTARPLGSPANWLGSNDYPGEALAEYKGGLVNFRLSVDLVGRPSQCSVQRAVNESLFAQTTCKALMKRARFSPALDAEGRPVPGLFLSSARFQMVN